MHYKKKDMVHMIINTSDYKQVWYPRRFDTLQFGNMHASEAYGL